jgi:hypothetical protein
MSRDPDGKDKALNDQWNPVNNPVNAQRIRDAARYENEERIGKMSMSEPIISEALAAATAEMLSTTPLPIFEGVTLEQFLKNKAFYLGYTGRQIVVEYLRFLTVRGASQQDEDGIFINPQSRNRPVLLWAHDTVITQKEAEVDLGFKYVELYASTLKINARRIEEALQKRFQYLPLGTRLWRCPDKGAKYDKPEDVGKVHKVYLTFSPNVSWQLRYHTIKVNH